MVDITVELAVMEAVARALARLDDNDARRRVLRWAKDRFKEPSTAAQPTGMATLQNDPTLAVDALEDLFDDAASSAASDRVDNLFDQQPVHRVERPPPTSRRARVTSSQRPQGSARGERENTASLRWAAATSEPPPSSPQSKSPTAALTRQSAESAAAAEPDSDPRSSPAREFATNFQRFAADFHRFAAAWKNA